MTGLYSRYRLFALMVPAVAGGMAFLGAAAPVQSDTSQGRGKFENVEVPFFDDAPKDPSFFAFRNKLMKAVEARDVAVLVSVLDPAIRNGFDAHEGIDEFKERWKLADKPEESPVWRELHEVLRLGGKLSSGKDKSTFVAPYCFHALPEKFDAFEFGMIVGEGVRVRSKPDETSEAVAKVGRIVVRMLPGESPVESKIGNETFPWRKVELPDGNVGYIWGKYVRSPIDYRAGFSNESGQWKMIYFLAGD